VLRVRGEGWPSRLLARSPERDKVSQVDAEDIAAWRMAQLRLRGQPYLLRTDRTRRSVNAHRLTREVAELVLCSFEERGEPCPWCTGLSYVLDVQTEAPVLCLMCGHRLATLYRLHIGFR
jgi:hypothetical protein